jgi:hypothetical protein
MDFERERRKYPTGQLGNKDEWKALVKHYEEYDVKASLLERYSKNVVQEKVRYSGNQC